MKLVEVHWRHKSLGSMALSWPQDDRIQCWRGPGRLGRQHIVRWVTSAPDLLVKPSSGQAHWIFVGSFNLRRRNGHQEGVSMDSRNLDLALNFRQLILLIWKLINTLLVTVTSVPYVPRSLPAPAPGPWHPKLGVLLEPLNGLTTSICLPQLLCSQTSQSGHLDIPYCPGHSLTLELWMIPHCDRANAWH